MLAAAALVVLRLALGCHFLYEGVWKIKHYDEFTAEPFLTQAKGPISPLFYAMVWDIDGRERLKVVEKDGKPSVDAGIFAARWDRIREKFVGRFAKSGDETLAQQAGDVSKKATAGLNAYLKENAEAIAAHFQSLDRFEQNAERGQDAPFQKQRHWDRMMELRGEAAAWINEIAAQETAFKNSLYALLDDEQRAMGSMPGHWDLLRWERMKLIDFAVTYGLTAIGICLMLGFFTPLAALGGAAFMCFVVATQPAWPGIYPPDPAVVGHALLVNKDFVEMCALLVVAATAAGRWGGLDFYVGRLLARFLKKWCRRESCPQ